MEPSSKFSISMIPSDMRIIDQIGDKLGLSRSELVRQAIIEFARAKGIVTEPSLKGVPPGAIEWIMAKSHGPFGDFKLPVCTRLVVEHGLAGKLDDDQLSAILKRYKEHVVFWSADDVVVRKELAEFAAAAKVPVARVWEVFYSS